MNATFDATRGKPIGLDELVLLAALQRRVDRKYVVSLADASRVADALPADTRILEIGGRRSFVYSSIYFDTPTRDSYLATAHGRRRRFKVRTREYRQSTTTYLEVKTRQGRYTVKERIPTPAPGLLTSAGATFVRDRLAVARVPGADVSRLAPCLETRYRRTTALLPDGSRVTFDTELGFSTMESGDRAAATRLLPHVAIVETKTAGPPSPVDRTLWHLSIRPVQMSKFGTGLASMEPSLPHTRWTRVLRTLSETTLAERGNPADLDRRKS